MWKCMSLGMVRSIYELDFFVLIHKVVIHVLA